MNESGIALMVTAPHYYYYYYYYYYYFSTTAVVLTLVQTKQIRINIHTRNNTKKSTNNTTQ